MKQLLIALMLIFGVSSVYAADEKKMDASKPAAATKLTDADAKDMIAVRVLEEKTYLLKKNGDKLEVVHHSEESPFLRIKHHGGVSSTIEKDVKDTLNAYREKLSKNTDEKPATLYEFHSDAARRMNAQWQKGAADAGQVLQPVVGVFGQLAALFI